MKTKSIKTIFRRVNAVVIALIVSAGFVLPFVLVSSGVASAGELEPREITITSSAPGATGVTYTASFTIATTGTAVQGVVIDFCANDPIPGDTCSTGEGTNLNGFSLGASPSVAETGLSTVGSWTAATNGTSPYHTLFYTDSSATTTGQTSAVTVTISNVTNPTPSSYPGSFFARIFTYSTASTASDYTSAIPGAYTDAGGDALSTAETIDVTAKVFETLTFCVYTTSCGTSPTATLGASANGALSTSNTYGSSNVSYELGTNAANGVTVTMTGTTLCSAATLSYANCEGAGSPQPTISAMTSNAAAVTGSSQFGMCVNVASFSDVTAAAEYTDGGSGHCPALTQGNAYTPGTSPLVGGTTFGFNDSNSAGGTNSSGGSTILSSTAPVVTDTGYLDFIANISNTTLTGIYQSNLNLVATSKF